MATERPEYRSVGFRLFVILAVLINLILTIALITQVREVQQDVAKLPPDLASKHDVAALRPLRVRETIRQNCVNCHSSRALGVTVSIEPAEMQRTIERLPSHTSVNIPQDQMERISASLLVARCARCHGEETLNLMVLKTVPERIAIAGFDDIPLAGQVVPGLTTLRVPRYAIGQQAGEMIRARLEGRRVRTRVVDAGYELVRRGSA